MLEEVKVRERKSAKHGKTYEYRFEIAQVGGERKWCSKGGFLTEKEAKKAGLESLSIIPKGQLPSTFINFSVNIFNFLLFLFCHAVTSTMVCR